MSDPGTFDLFASERSTLALDPGAVLLGGFALPEAPALLADIADIARTAPFRQLSTPGGRTMSVAMTNCGPLGWTSDRRGYRYVAEDPQSGIAWPAMPDRLRSLARRAADAAGFAGFDPDACLINRYAPGTRMGLHQDKDETADAPIVSVSLGVSATFLWGGSARGDRPRRIRLDHGDVVVWGGPARLAFHGVAPLAKEHHPGTGDCRFNLTFRRVR